MPCTAIETTGAKSGTHMTTDSDLKAVHRSIVRAGRWNTKYRTALARKWTPSAKLMSMNG